MDREQKAMGISGQKLLASPLALGKACVSTAAVLVPQALHTEPGGLNPSIEAPCRSCKPTKPANHVLGLWFCMF